MLVPLLAETRRGIHSKSGPLNERPRPLVRLLVMNLTRFFLRSVLPGLLLASRLQAADAQLTLDLTRPGATISPYLYGQFIEHLGRCIHDGVWSEKLRDRKFLLAPTNSPWQRAGRWGGLRVPPEKG